MILVVKGRKRDGNDPEKRLLSGTMLPSGVLHCDAHLHYGVGRCCILVLAAMPMLCVLVTSVGMTLGTDTAQGREELSSTHKSGTESEVVVCLQRHDPFLFSA